MNIFQRIGNKIEDNKKKRELIEDKYWKLKPIERIDYDSKKKDILNNNNFNVLSFITFYFKVILYVALFFITMSIIFKVDLIDSGALMIGSLFDFVPLAILVGIVFHMVASINIIDEVKKLNKRFKLE